MTFRLQGHHFRLLDSLDDGWKPFWLDSLRLAPGRTERIAFLAEFPGSYLLETRSGDGNTPNRMAWYAVE